MDHSPLGGLPPELRNRIYGYAIDFQTVYIDVPEAHGIMHPLTQTCRQLRAEAYAMALSRLSIDYWGRGRWDLLAFWLLTIGTYHCSLLRKIGHAYNFKRCLKRLTCWATSRVCVERQIVAIEEGREYGSVPKAYLFLEDFLWDMGFQIRQWKVTIHDKTSVYRHTTFELPKNPMPVRQWWQLR